MVADDIKHKPKRTLKLAEYKLEPVGRWRSLLPILSFTIINKAFRKIPTLITVKY